MSARGRGVALADAEAADAASGDASLREVLELLSRRAAELAGLDGAGVALVEGDRLRYVANWGVIAGTAYSCGVDEPAARVLRTGTTWLVQDSERATEPYDVEAAARSGLRGWCQVPLVHDGEVLGLLSLVHGRPNAFSHDTVTGLEQLARMAGSLVVGARAIDARRRLVDVLERTERRAQAVLDGLDEGIVQWHGDGTITCNPRALHLLCLEPGDLDGYEGGPIDGLEVQDAGGHPAAQFGSAAYWAAETRQTIRGVGRVRRHGGPWRWVAVTAAPQELDEAGVPTSVVVSYVDITGLKETEARALDAARLVETAFRHAPNGVLVLDEHANVLLVNEALCRLLGVEEAEILGPWDEDRFAHPDDRDLGFPEVRAMFRGEVDSGRMEKRMRHRDGSIRWCEVTAAQVPAELPGDRCLVLMQLADLTQRRTAQRLLFHQAFHDRITELPNRQVLRDRIEEALAADVARGLATGVVLVDVDRLGRVMDDLGVEVGDALARAIAVRLRAATPSALELARARGDGFAVVLSGLDPTTAHGDVAAAAADLLEAFDRPFDVGGRRLTVRAAVGVSVALGGTGASGVDPLRDADAAIRRARSRGEAGVAVADARLRVETAERQDLEAGLREMLGRGELVVHYQPEVDLVSGRLTAFEALVRWDRPGLGIQPPAAFLDVAAELGLLDDIGRWVLVEATNQLRRWSDAHPSLRRAIGEHSPAGLGMAVNVAASQVVPDLVADVRRASLVVGDARRLSLEITEGQVLALSDEVRATLSRVRALGVSVGLDDFGTSYATLATLAGLDLDFLKIDRTFTAGLGSSRGATVAVRATVGLADALGLRVIGEGIETAEQLRALQDLRVDIGQGWLFGRPRAAAALEDLLAQAAAGLPVLAPQPTA